MVCLFACFTCSNQQKLTHPHNNAIATPSNHISDHGGRESLSIDDESTKQQQQQLTKQSFKDNVQLLKEKNVGEELSLNEKQVKFEFEFELNDKSNEKGNDDIISNVVSASTNHRYQNCESEDYGDVDLEGGNDKMLVQEESSDLFSLSIDSRKHVGGSELGENEVTSLISKCDSFKDGVKVVECNSNARDTSDNVEELLVLNPVENLTQWKSAKERTSMRLSDEDKENINAEQDLNIPVSAEPTFELLSKNLNGKADNKKRINREIGVDTSLSSWLVEGETTPASNNKSGNSGKGSSPTTSQKDRSVLGVLTMEEVKKLSTSNSPKRTRSKTPSKTGVIGTVGSYWRLTGQATDSDSGSSCKGKPKCGSNKVEGENVKWNCPPFEAKLERGEV